MPLMIKLYLMQHLKSYKALFYRKQFGLPQLFRGKGL